jgi:uncharacterized protein with GYD domain
MSTFILFTRLATDAVEHPSDVEALEGRVMSVIRAECPDVEWLHSYATLGDCDYVDIFTAPDIETATKVASIVRLYGHATTEVWPATDWDRFKQIVADLEPHAEESVSAPEEAGIAGT